MFIKILTPNHNGKIELTVKDLEALIKEAVDKAILEDRANRSYTWPYLYSSVSNTPYTITCNSTSEIKDVMDNTTLEIEGIKGNITGHAGTTNTYTVDTALLGSTFNNFKREENN